MQVNRIQAKYNKPSTTSFYFDKKKTDVSRIKKMVCLTRGHQNHKNAMKNQNPVEIKKKNYNLY